MGIDEKPVNSSSAGTWTAALSRFYAERTAYLFCFRPYFLTCTTDGRHDFMALVEWHSGYLALENNICRYTAPALKQHCFHAYQISQNWG